MDRLGQQIKYDAFTKGVNQEVASHLLDAGEVLRSQNLVLRDNAYVQAPGTSTDLRHVGAAFDGTDDYLNITNANQTGLHTAGTMTIRIVFTTAVVTAAVRTLMSQWANTDATRSYRLYRENATLKFRIADNTGTEGVDSSVTLVAGTVYRVEASYNETTDTSTIKVAAAGTAWASATVDTQVHATITTRAARTVDTRVGADGDSGAVGNYWSGTIFFVSWEDAIPTSTFTFQPHYDASDGQEGLWWMVPNAAGTAVLDFSPDTVAANNNDLTINGGLTFDSTNSGLSADLPVMMTHVIGAPQDTYIFAAPWQNQNAAGGLGDSLAILTPGREYTLTYDAGDAAVRVVDRGGANLSAPTFGSPIIVPAHNSLEGAYFVDSTDGNIFVCLHDSAVPRYMSGASSDVANLSTSLAGSTRAKIFRNFGSRGNLYNFTDSGGAAHLSRHQWSSLNTIRDGDWDTTNDFTDLEDTDGEILGALPLSNAMFIYKRQGAIIEQTLSGAAAPVWRYRTVVSGVDGLISARSLVNAGGVGHIYCGVGDVFLFDGQSPPKGLAVGRISNQIFDSLDVDDHFKLWALWNHIHNEYWLFVPASGSWPITYWVWSMKYNAWSGPMNLDSGKGNYVTGLVYNQPISSTGTSTRAKKVTLFTTHGWAVDVADATESYDGNVISAQLELPEARYVTAGGNKTGEIGRFLEVELDAAVDATASLELHTSLDEGATYTNQGSPDSSITYDSTFRRYVWYIDEVGQKLRLRFIKTVAGTAVKFARAVVNAISAGNI